MTDIDDLLEDMTAKRRRLALQVRDAHDVKLPHLKHWNYEPCDKHRSLGAPQQSCMRCGAHFKRHQRTGISWLYLLPQGGLLADIVGAGKTITLLGLLALLKEKGELTNRAIIVVGQNAAIGQWQMEAARLVPSLHVEIAVGTPSQRIQKYTSNWDILLIGPQMFIHEHHKLLKLGPFSVVCMDDVDAIRNDTATARAAQLVARSCERYIPMNGTPLQNNLHEIYRLGVPIGTPEIFGNNEAFQERYVRREQITLWDPVKGKKQTKTKVTGYKHMDEFKALVKPIYLRRTHKDFDDGDYPEIVPNDIPLDMTPHMAERYKELQAGVFRMLKEEGVKLRHASSMAKLVYGEQILAGLATIDDHYDPEENPKHEWITDKVTKDLAGEKTVVFFRYVKAIKALQDRLSDEGVGHVTIWGQDSSDSKHKMLERKAAQDKFWNDDNCQVLMGTSSIEKSLNLQISCNLINGSLLLNPKRMEQLAGRIRRMGSTHSHVYVHNLYIGNSQEERYFPVLEAKQALGDYVFDNASELFRALTAAELAQLITG